MIIDFPRPSQVTLSPLHNYHLFSFGRVYTTTHEVNDRNPGRVDKAEQLQDHQVETTETDG